MKKIYYLSYYAIPDIHKKRNFVLSAVNKISYICNAINRNDIDVEIISASGSEKFELGKRIQINDHLTLKLFTSLGKGIKPRRIINRWIFNIKLFISMLVTLNKNSTVIVYHSLGYMSIVKALKKIIKFKLVLEIEEIYSDVSGNKKKRKKELEFFKLADAYIFPTDLMDELVNTGKKSSVIIYGTYQVEEQREKCEFAYDALHEKKHLLYAGTFDPRKGGASSAASSAEFLSCNYHVHILGFGTDMDKKNLLDLIDKISKFESATVTMDGLLSGEEYIRFVQSCDVGFSTQMPDAAFNDTSFPSKVLSYLANGLRVVTVRIPALERSAISDLLFYYNGSDPKAIAEAVMQIDWNEPYDSRTKIRELDKDFVKEIGEILK